MPTLAIIDGVVVRMFYFDHDPAHFHAVFGGQEMRVAIGSLKVIDGGLPPGKRRKIMDWAARRQAELALCWVRCRAGEKPGRIEP